MTTSASAGKRPLDARGARVIDFVAYRARHDSQPSLLRQRETEGHISTALLAREERRLRQEMAYLQRRATEVQACLREIHDQMGSIERLNGVSWYVALSRAIESEPPDDPLIG